MNDGFSFDSSIICSELFRVSWVNLGGDRRQNLKPKFAQEPEQSDFTYGVYLVAAEHLWSPYMSYTRTGENNTVFDSYLAEIDRVGVGCGGDRRQG